MLLVDEGKQAHDHQSRYDTHGYDVLRHGCHATASANRKK
jgi:hypothetical protein